MFRRTGQWIRTLARNLRPHYLRPDRVEEMTTTHPNFWRAARVGIALCLHAWNSDTAKSERIHGTVARLRELVPPASDGIREPEGTFTLHDLCHFLRLVEDAGDDLVLEPGDQTLQVLIAQPYTPLFTQLFMEQWEAMYQGEIAQEEVVALETIHETTEDGLWEDDPVLRPPHYEDRDQLPHYLAGTKPPNYKFLPERERGS